MRLRIYGALAIVYLVWGSTYLGIKVGLEGFPPMAIGALRFIVAGALLYAWTSWRSRPGRPPWRQWRAAAIAGTLMLVGGNGAVTWAEQRIDSGVAALLVATVPLWMSLLAWAWQRQPLSARGVVGLGAGFVGVAVLVRPSGQGLDPASAAVVVTGALAWAAGSLYVRQASLPADPLRATALQMLAAGAVFTALSVAGGEPARFDPATLRWPAVAAVGYLAVFGSLVAFTAYTWLLRAASPATVSTYAYVNPVVAVLLGVVFLAEPLTTGMAVAGALVLVGVGLIVTRRRDPVAREPERGPRRPSWRTRHRPRPRAVATPPVAP